MTKKDIKIVSAVEDMYYSDTDEFTYSDGLNIAAAFWSGLGKSLDPAYGELVFYIETWGYDADDNWISSIDKIQDHACSEDELSISEVPDNPSFFEPSKDTGREVSLNLK